VSLWLVQQGVVPLQLNSLSPLLVAECSFVHAVLPRRLVSSRVAWSGVGRCGCARCPVGALGLSSVGPPARGRCVVVAPADAEKAR